jgi:hypothetical protein
MPSPDEPSPRQRLLDLLATDPLAEVADGAPPLAQAGPDDDWVQVGDDESKVKLGGGFDPAIDLTRRVIRIEQG